MAASNSAGSLKRKYSSYTLNDCCKNLIGMLMNSENEATRSGIKSGLEEFGINVPKQTLSIWKKKWREE